MGADSARQRAWKERRRAAAAANAGINEQTAKDGNTASVANGYHSSNAVDAQKGLPRRAQSRGGWEFVEGSDELNDEVLEQHRRWVQMGLLGQGAPDGYADHEFPPQARSIDGLQGPLVKKGQEALIDLISKLGGQQAFDGDDDAEPPPPDAPRCQCGRRTRQNRVRIPGIAYGRPYFRCAGRACRFLGFGDLPSSPYAQSLQWVRFPMESAEVSHGNSTSSKHIVVGLEGYRPEDVRVGPEAEHSCSSFVDAISLLAERPPLVQRILPNAWPPVHASIGNSCHEVRLCVEGHWRAILLDEYLVTSSCSSSLQSSRRRKEESELAFGRAAGNQLWVPLIEKGYAKSFGAYQFALVGAPLDEVLADLTGAPVETRLVEDTPENLADDLHAVELWDELRQAHDSGLLVACTTKAIVGPGSVHALLDIVEQDDALAGTHTSLPPWQKALRLRNPRGGAYATADHREQLLSALGAVPAEGSTYADGSFWVQYPQEFFAGFARVDICYESVADTGFVNSRSFEGEFTPDRSLGIRGCAVHMRPATDAVQCWLTVIQPMPLGTRLLRPAMGRVLSDIGLLVLEVGTKRVAGIALGGSWRSVSHKLRLEPGVEYVVLPISFRSWPGPVTLRTRTDARITTRPAQAESFAEEAWEVLFRLAADSVLTVVPSVEKMRRRIFPITLAQTRGRGAARDLQLMVLEFEGAAIVVVQNLCTEHGILVEGTVDASHATVLTSRGVQFGSWLGPTREGKTESAEPIDLPNDQWDTRPDWRRYTVEDVVPPCAKQLVCVISGVARPCWGLELGPIRAKFVPPDSIGKRPSVHAFAPRDAKGSSGSRPSSTAANFSTSFAQDIDDDEALRYALALSLAEEESLRSAAPQVETATSAAGASAVTGGGRWGRRTRAAVGTSVQSAVATCDVCKGAGVEPASLSCCQHKCCASCARRWAESCVLERGVLDVTCPVCTRRLDDSELLPLLGSRASSVLMALRDNRPRSSSSAQPARQPPTEAELGLAPGQLERLGTKRCPACGTGTQRDVETCHKMICRHCRAKFCFRCLSRLEYFNCGCTGSEHSFVDPVDGRIIAH